MEPGKDAPGPVYRRPHALPWSSSGALFPVEQITEEADRLFSRRPSPPQQSLLLNLHRPLNYGKTDSVQEENPRLGPVEFSELLVEQLQAVKALRLCRIDLQGQSSLTDMLLICEGRSHLHCRGIADRVAESLRQRGIRHDGIEGEREGNWILLDYGEVILHIFHPEIRRYYDLEGFHLGCPVESWPDPQ